MRLLNPITSEAPPTLAIRKPVVDMRYTVCLLLLIATAPASVEYDRGAILNFKPALTAGSCFQVNTRRRKQSKTKAAFARNTLRRTSPPADGESCDCMRSLQTNTTKSHNRFEEGCDPRDTTESEESWNSPNLLRDSYFQYFQ